MILRNLLISFVLGLSALKAADRPNILFIVSEDNSEHIGCYGEKRVHTPALDALAKDGVRYTRAYVPYSVCSPSRAVFLTGLYTRQTGHIGLATHKFSFYKDFQTMPSYFQQAGYYTGFLGKVHVNPEHLVTNFVDHKAIPQANFGKTISIKKYADEAKKVMQNAKKANKPFCLIINYPDAHRKYVGKSKNGYPTVLAKPVTKVFPWIGSDSDYLRKELENYFNCMNRLDEGIGMVLKNMEELKLRDNTMIVYISDHGADFPRAKGSSYECGVRIPMIVNYPKAFSKGKVEKQMVSTIDILPTMLDVCDIKTKNKLPGNNLLKIDKGETKGHEYIHTFTTGSAPSLQYLQFSIRDDRYKLIYNPYRHKNLLAASRYTNSKLPADQHVKSFLFPDEYELFDLQEDPYEWKNLASSKAHQEIKSRLIAEMKKFQTEIKDPLGDKKNLDAFQDEQIKHQKIKYRKKGFVWPHLKMFEEANK
ncbi:sulfatase [Rubritalea tangerina]|uniref:Sulfatase n=2 Tax=Rubritalea tangerina TaxID=430798 RepID=A0ABW4ZF34_9BACT